MLAKAELWIPTLFREGFRTDCSKRHCFSSLETEQSPLTLVVWYLPALGKESSAVFQLPVLK